MIRKKLPPEEYVIDLTGPDGNAMVMLAHAKKLARQLSLNADEISNEMMSGDYENLISVFDSYFGHIVVLER